MGSLGRPAWGWCLHRILPCQRGPGGTRVLQAGRSSPGTATAPAKGMGLLSACWWPRAGCWSQCRLGCPCGSVQLCGHGLWLCFATRLGYPQQSRSARLSPRDCRAACPTRGCLPAAIAGCSCFLFLGLQILACTRAGFLHPLTPQGLGSPSWRTLPSGASNKPTAWWEALAAALLPSGKARLGQGGGFQGQRGSCLSLPNLPPAPQHLDGLSCGPVRSHPALHSHHHSTEEVEALGTGCAYSCSEFCRFSACGSQAAWGRAQARSLPNWEAAGNRLGPAAPCCRLASWCRVLQSPKSAPGRAGPTLVCPVQPCQVWVVRGQSRQSRAAG